VDFATCEENQKFKFNDDMSTIQRKISQKRPIVKFQDNRRNKINWFGWKCFMQCGWCRNSTLSSSH